MPRAGKAQGREELLCEGEAEGCWGYGRILELWDKDAQGYRSILGIWEKDAGSTEQGCWGYRRILGL